MSHWDKLQESSALAQRARDDISATLTANNLQASLQEQYGLVSLRETQIAAERDNRLHLAHQQQQQIQNELDALKQQVHQQHRRTLGTQSVTSSQGTGLSMSELEKAMKRIMKEEEDEDKPRKKKKDMSGLKNLLEGIDDGDDVNS